MDSNGRKQKSTLKDIALKTGYSINTVSRALRDKEDIAVETREMIKTIAKEMGHVNNMLASSLRLGYTNTIAVILGDVSNPHFSIMMREIEIRARALGYSSFLINTNEDEKAELQAIRSSVNKNVDGIIICPTQKTEDSVQYLQDIGIPFVLIGRKFDGLDTDYVICNDEMGGYLATRKLLELGHRRILVLHGPTYISSARDRLAGYMRAHREFGVDADENLIREVPVTADGSEEVLSSLAERNIAYSGVFAFSDMIAWHVWASLHKKGVNVPRDCSIIGFDHIQSRLRLPFDLTSVSSYKTRMSNYAVDILIKKIKSANSSERQKIVIQTKLAEGETTARFRG